MDKPNCFGTAEYNYKSKICTQCPYFVSCFEKDVERKTKEIAKRKADESRP